MNLHAIRKRVVDSSRDDWNQIPCWGAGQGPSYHYGLTSERDDKLGIQTEARAHSNLAVLIDDVHISIAWGYDPDDSLYNAGLRPQLDYEFLPELDDSEDVSRLYADVFYSGNLVDRKLFAVADGGRYFVPIPRRTYPNKTGHGPGEHGVPQFHYTRWELGFATILNAFEHAQPFADLLAQMDYKVDD